MYIIIIIIEKKEISVAKQQTEVDHTLPGETGLKRYETDTHGKTFDGEEWK